jgi:hypothetical protein
VKEWLSRALVRLKEIETELRGGGLYWVFPFSVLLLVAGGLIFLSVADRRGALPRWSEPAPIGHVTHAYGTVKRTTWMSTPGALTGLFSSMDESWNRLESGRPILVPVRSGDLIQTGEESSAEILFFGGNIMHLEPGSLALFEDGGEDVAIRLVIGRAYLELPDGLIDGKKVAIRKADGTLSNIPKDSRLVLTLNAAQSLSSEAASGPGGSTDSVENIEMEPGYESPTGVELRFLAHGEEVSNRYALLVPPIEDRGRFANPKRPNPSMKTIPITPEPEDSVDIEKTDGISFKWKKIEGSPKDPVVSYEIIVRPAPGYEVEDTARKVRVLHSSYSKDGEIPIEKVDGGGVFLWSVRAVTASGERGPASTPRWLEIRFPKRLRAPEVLKPKIE